MPPESVRPYGFRMSLERLAEITEREEQGWRMIAAGEREPFPFEEDRADMLAYIATLEDEVATLKLALDTVEIFDARLV